MPEPFNLPTQIIAYLKRHPSLTREEFYTHWKNSHAPIVLPFFEKHGVLNYQQIQASDFIVPNADQDSNSTETIEFDGIALTLFPTLDGMANRFSDPYFTQVIEVDEARFLDRDAPGKGIVATFCAFSESIIDPDTADERGIDGI